MSAGINCFLFWEKKDYWLAEEENIQLLPIQSTGLENIRIWPKTYLLKGREQLWVVDITYIDTLEGNAYLHLLTDAYSKQIMGYELYDTMEAILYP